MPTLAAVMKRIKPRPRAAPVAAGGGGGTGTGTSTSTGTGATVTLEFASDVEVAAAGIRGKVASTDPNIAFSFTEVAPRVGLPRDLEISETGTLKLLVTFPADYDGLAYVYTDSLGIAHAGTFPSGNGTADY